MTAWWYAEKERQVGPFGPEDIKHLFQAGTITPATMLWREGMEAWRPLAQIDELHALKAAVPPPLPATQPASVQSMPLASRWSRFLARLFDLNWQTTLVALVIVPFLNPATPALFLGLIALPMALILDGVLYPIVRRPPGKALLGLRLARKDGSRLSFWQYLDRNLSLWASGLAFGLPILFVFALVRQSFRLSKGRAASYDTDSGFEVRAESLTLTRKAIFGALLIGIFAGTLTLDVLAFKR